jgi:hypothetical protein
MQTGTAVCSRNWKNEVKCTTKITEIFLRTEAEAEAEAKAVAVTVTSPDKYAGRV